MTPFHRALQHTLADEGYYTDSGPTYRGIDRRYWPEWEGWAIIDDWLGGGITVALCHGYSTPRNLEHELMHCRGYADHPLF